MSDLFPTTTQELPALERARKNYDAAKLRLDTCPDDQWEIAQAKAAEICAMYDLKEAELAELQRQKK